MSVSHPYLKQLKVFVLQFCSDSERNNNNTTDEYPAHSNSKVSIRDDNAALQSFCRNLEDIFTTGIQRAAEHQRWASNHDPHTKYWQWLRTLLTVYPTREILAPLQFCIEYCKESKKAITDTGKGRLWLRCALNKKVIGRAIRLLRQHKGLLYQHYGPNSILGDDILSEMLLSLLTILEEKVHFALNVRLSSFLDETWELPCLRRYELVPCDRVGLDLLQVDGRIMVMEVETGSVGDEDLKIEPGDILDDLYGESLRKAQLRKVVGLLDEFRGSPIYLSVIKCIWPDGNFYRPISIYLDAADLSRRTLFDIRERRVRELAEINGDLSSISLGRSNDRAAHSLPLSLLQQQQSEDLGDTQTNNGTHGDQGEKTQGGDTSQQEMEGRFAARFMGCVNVGNVGTVEQIEHGVYKVMTKKDEPKKKVLIQLAETDITVFCAETNKVLFQHGFPEIGSCGRRIDYPRNFSYIAGETTCTIAKQFYCYVFEAGSDDKAKLILKGIAEGFERTHWAV